MRSARRTVTVAHGGWFDDVFLFDQLPGGGWAVAVAVLVCSAVVLRVMKHRRRREQLRRRRQIRARLHADESFTVNGVEPAPVREIDLTEPGLVIDLRDRVVYRSEVTLESGDTVETGVVMPFPPD